jgi:hypothetical protein
MNDIVGNGPMFRDEDDFAADAEWRQWVESDEGRETLAARRLEARAAHEAKMASSAEYRQMQAEIEAALSASAPGEYILVSAWRPNRFSR